jgi:hypothetical protein
MDTLVISRCGSFIIHLKQTDLEGEQWVNLSTGKTYRTQSGAVKSAFRLLKKLKRLQRITNEKKSLKTAKKRQITRKFKYKRGANKSKN